MTAVVWSQAIGTVFLGIVGLWLAQNIRRQMRIKLAERQVDAYVQLWMITAVDRWYFDDGNGVFMPRLTRNLFVAVQHCPAPWAGWTRPDTPGCA